MAKYLRPRRGSMANAQAQNFVLKSGEMFLEYPSGSIGKGPGRIMIGDGSSSYSAARYVSTVSTDFRPFITDPSIYIPVFPNSTVPTSGQSVVTEAALLNSSTFNGSASTASATLPTIIGSIKKVLCSHDQSITKLNNDLVNVNNSINDITTDLNNKADINHIHSIATTDINGFLPKLSGTTKEYLNGQGSWSEIPLATTTTEGLIHKLPQNNPDIKFLNGNNVFTNLPIVNTTQSGVFTANMYNNLNNTTSTFNNQISTIQDSYNSLDTRVTTLSDKVTEIGNVKALYTTYSTSQTMINNWTLMGDGSDGQYIPIRHSGTYLLIGDIQIDTNKSGGTGFDSSYFGNYKLAIGGSADDTKFITMIPVQESNSHRFTFCKIIDISVDSVRLKPYIRIETTISESQTVECTFSTNMHIVDINGVDH